MGEKHTGFDEDEDRDDELDDQGDDGDDDDEASAVFRIQGIGRVVRGEQRRILVEDEDGCDVRIRLERDSALAGSVQKMTLDDAELVEFVRALERVARRRGLLDAGGN